MLPSARWTACTKIWSLGPIAMLRTPSRPRTTSGSGVVSRIEALRSSVARPAVPNVTSTAPVASRRCSAMSVSAASSAFGTPVWATVAATTIAPVDWVASSISPLPPLNTSPVDAMPSPPPNVVSSAPAEVSLTTTTALAPARSAAT